MEGGGGERKFGLYPVGLIPKRKRTKKKGRAGGEKQRASVLLLLLPEKCVGQRFPTSGVSQAISGGISNFGKVPRTVVHSLVPVC